MPSLTVENVCYNNSNFRISSDERDENDITFQNNDNPNPTADNENSSKLKINHKICPSFVFHRIVNREIFSCDNRSKGAFFVFGMILMICLSKSIHEMRPNRNIKLACNVCGNGSKVYYARNHFGEYWGDRCDEKNPIESSYTCKDNSACVRVETSHGDGFKKEIEDFRDYVNKTYNMTIEEYMKKNNWWLLTFLPGVIKGCVHGAGHSWVRNQCHTFNSSDWKFQKLRYRYNATWSFIKTCVCTEDNCN